MATPKWLKWLVVGGIALAVLGIGASLFSSAAYGRIGNWMYDGCGAWGGWGMDSWGGSGMMGYRPLGWFGMILGLLIPLGVIALLIASGIWLVKAVTANSSPFAPTRPASRACPSCGQSIQADWRTCPYCGTALKE